MKSAVATIIVIVIVSFIGIAIFNSDKSEDNEQEIIFVENLEDTSKIISDTATAEIVTTVESITTQSQTIEVVKTEQSTSRDVEVQTSQPETTTAQPQETTKKEEQTTAPKQEETTNSGGKLNGKDIQLGFGDGSDGEIEEMTTGDYDNIEKGKNYIGN